MTQDVDWHNGFDAATSRFVIKRTLSPLAFVFEEVRHLLWVHLPVVGFRIDEHRPCTGVAYGVRWCDESERRDQHLVAWLHSTHNQGDVQSRCAIDRGDS